MWAILTNRSFDLDDRCWFVDSTYRYKWLARLAIKRRGTDISKRLHPIVVRTTQLGPVEIYTLPTGNTYVDRRS